MKKRSLVTLDDYKEYASIYSTDFDDKLQSLVTKVSDYVKHYCGRTFIDYYDKANAEYFDIVEYSTYPGYHFTGEFPIREVVSVEVSLDNGNTYSLHDDFVLDRVKDAVFIGGVYEGINAYKTTYKGGYENTPEDLKLACLDLVEYYYKEEQVPRKSQGNTILEYVMTSDLPSHIRRVLDLYRVIL